MEYMNAHENGKNNIHISFRLRSIASPNIVGLAISIKLPNDVKLLFGKCSSHIFISGFQSNC